MFFYFSSNLAMEFLIFSVNFYLKARKKIVFFKISLKKFENFKWKKFEISLKLDFFNRLKNLNYYSWLSNLNGFVTTFESSISFLTSNCSAIL